MTKGMSNLKKNGQQMSTGVIIGGNQKNQKSDPGSVTDSGDEEEPGSVTTSGDEEDPGSVTDSSDKEDPGLVTDSGDEEEPEHIRKSMGKETWSICYDKYFEV